MEDMAVYRIYVDVTDEQRKEITQHLMWNGYACYNQWSEDGNSIRVDYEELYEVMTILDDRGIGYSAIQVG